MDLPPAPEPDRDRDPDAGPSPVTVTTSTQSGGTRLNWIRRSSWLVALLPAIAAFTYVWAAARYPEPVAGRVALHEPTTVWYIDQWLDTTGEPLQPLQRGLLLGALEVPGATLQLVVVLAALAAVLIAWFGSRLVRSSVAVEGWSGPLAFGGIALLCCSPSFGADWLQAERVGMFAPPLLLLGALLLLQRERFFVWRMLAVLMLVAAAPLFHDAGVLLGVALIPAVLGAAGRAEAPRWLWAITTLVFGVVASLVSFYPAGGLHGDEVGLFAHLAAAPGARVLDLLAAVGRGWLDLWPDRRIGELALGAATLTLLAVLPFVPPREGARSAASWWSCAIFGVLLVPWVTMRHGFDLSPWLGRELHYGLFLLPLGVLGLLASRAGNHAWSIGLGALAVLAAQDWPRGAEDLRAARAEAIRVEASLALPPAFADHTVVSLSPFASAMHRDRLLGRGWVPDPTFDCEAAAKAAQASPPRDELGNVISGSPIDLHGMVRSAIVHEQVGAVLVAAVHDDRFELLGATLPRFVGRSRDAQWRVSWGTAVAEGTKLVAFAYLPRQRSVVRIGGVRLVKDGALTSL